MINQEARDWIAFTMSAMLGIVIGFCLWFSPKPTIPCLASPLPVAVKMQYLEEPAFVGVVMPDGERLHAMSMLIEPKSMEKFFDYVTALETTVESAKKCVQPPVK